MPYQSGFRPGLFDGQTIFIPGGGGGLGRCIAHELAFLGAKIILAGRTMAKLDKARIEIEADGGEVLGCYTGELRDEKVVVSMVGNIAAEHGSIHGLVNAAGGQFPAELKNLSLNGWNAVIENNLTSYFLMSREVFRQSMQKTGGNIVNIGADYARGMAGMGHNGAARAGLSNLTFTSSMEWASAGVRVNCVIPGFIATTGLDRYPESAWDNLKSVVKRAPLQRHGTAAEVSAGVVFLMSDMAAYITGTELRIDGGMHNGSGGFLFQNKGVEARQQKIFNGFHRDETAKLLNDR
ncbi:MAG: SDR family oxidoreductase [bacterium]|nr:SDR family oxidoreductase [Gammaproteobacteria bacterium]HIL97996.1 SDR family oxidoreductase [Pseudomonadales bacterium]